jgi:hypothetical protein
MAAGLVRGETVEREAPYEFGLFDYLKGKPTENQIFIGMFTAARSVKRRFQAFHRSFLLLNYIFNPSTGNILAWNRC